MVGYHRNQAGNYTAWCLPHVAASDLNEVFHKTPIKPLACANCSFIYPAGV